MADQAPELTADDLSMVNDMEDQDDAQAEQDATDTPPDGEEATEKEPEKSTKMLIDQDETDRQKGADEPEDDDVEPEDQEQKADSDEADKEAQASDEKDTEEKDGEPDWRDRMSGGDPKIRKVLNRYASEAGVARALVALRAKMDSNEVVRAKPKGDPDDPAYQEAMKQWRAQEKIPEKPDGYLDDVPEGLVVGEDDQEKVADFLAAMHDADAPPGYVHAALLWYNAIKEQNAELRAQYDDQIRIEADDELRAEWGTDYRGNLNGVRNMVKTIGNEDLLNRLFTARMDDGQGALFGDDPEMLRLLVAIDKQLNPHGTLPLPDSEAGKAMASEKEVIQKAMGDRTSDYYNGPKDEHGETQMARRYREILESEEKMTNRGAR